MEESIEQTRTISVTSLNRWLIVSLKQCKPLIRASWLTDWQTGDKKRHSYFIPYTDLHRKEPSTSSLPTALCWLCVWVGGRSQTRSFIFWKLDITPVYSVIIQLYGVQPHNVQLPYILHLPNWLVRTRIPPHSSGICKGELSPFPYFSRTSS